MQLGLGLEALEVDQQEQTQTQFSSPLDLKVWEVAQVLGFQVLMEAIVPTYQEHVHEENVFVDSLLLVWEKGQLVLCVFVVVFWVMGLVEILIVPTVKYPPCQHWDAAHVFLIVADYSVQLEYSTGPLNRKQVV